jgi:hypothetical protein
MMAASRLNDPSYVLDWDRNFSSLPVHIGVWIIHQPILRVLEALTTTSSYKIKNA